MTLEDNLGSQSGVLIFHPRATEARGGIVRNILDNAGLQNSSAAQWVTVFCE